MMPLHPRMADKEYVVGQRYILIDFEPRSIASHNHQFAFVKEAWSSLPEHLLDTYPTPECLRKKCLIRAGYSHSQMMICKSKAEAERVAAFMRPMADDTVVSVNGNVVTRFIAMSQSVKAMGAKEFYQSKEKIIEIIAALIGVEPQTLKGVQAAA